MGLASELQTVLVSFRGRTLPDGSNLRAFGDSGQITPPCVWVPVPSISFNYSKRVADVLWAAYLIAPNQTTASISSTLSELVDAVAGLFPFTDGNPQPLTLPGGGQPVPSLQLVWTARVSIGVTP